MLITNICRGAIGARNLVTSRTRGLNPIQLCFRQIVAFRWLIPQLMTSPHSLKPQITNDNSLHRLNFVVLRDFILKHPPVFFMINVLFNNSFWNAILTVNGAAMTSLNSLKPQIIKDNSLHQLHFVALRDFILKHPPFFMISVLLYNNSF